MSIKGKVGRHAMAGGRQCQNWPTDQQVVVNLLNRITADKGGAHGTLTERIISGISGDKLYGAILVFETHHFPRQRSGFVEPNGPMLRRMEGEAAAAGALASLIKPRAEARLEILRRNLFDDGQAKKADSFWTMHKASFQPLVDLAYKHISNLIEGSHKQLPWPVALFGRAYVLSEDDTLYYLPTYVSTAKHVLLRRERKDPLFLKDGKTGEITEDPKLPEMSYGRPVDTNKRIYTTHLPAILLYRNGGVTRLRPYQSGTISALEPNLTTGYQPSPWDDWGHPNPDI